MLLLSSSSSRASARMGTPLSCGCCESDLDDGGEEEEDEKEDEDEEGASPPPASSVSREGG
ncbi:hypothetical protein PsorP6_004224 [Peronosclerospora sorghi]|uniref:Uncharacterized protein n=1 Tax=Peronosclerospora sorghi TaxID=230839 RepID=A0ACC0VMM0_9STRA|nr:hypothetical protein PsorP6_004224 [Peronosclerospora sorghi]